MFHSCGGGGKVPLCRFPLFTSKHMKVVNTPADVMMQNYEKVGRQRYLHWWMNTWRCMAFFTVCVLMVCRSTWRRPRHSYSKFSLSGEPLKPNHTQVLSPLQHCNTRRSLLQQSSTCGLALPSPAVRVHSCSSSSSWSSSMASIWVLEHTSLIGAESSPSTTSSLDISLFFCGHGKEEEMTTLKVTETRGTSNRKLLRPLLY